MFPTIQRIVFVLFCAVPIIVCEETGSAAEYFEEATPGEVSVIAGRSVDLKCKVGPNDSNFEYRWKLNGRELQLLPNSTKRQLIAGEGGTLRIFGAVEATDGGEYICIAIHSSGRSLTSSPSLVRIYGIGNEATVVLKDPQITSSITEGANLTLKCLAPGSTNYKVDWFRNDELILQSEKFLISNDTLHMRKVSPVDNGVYRCRALNIAGSIASIKNFALAIPGDGWATIQTIPTDQIVKEGTAVRLDCIYQNADVQEWYFKATGPLDNSTRFSVLPNGSLIINSVSSIDEGYYSCVGIRQESMVVPQKYIAAISLANLMPMNSSNLDPESKNKVYLVPEGDRFQISCITPFGRPAASIYWKDPRGKILGGVSGNNNGRVHIRNNSLIITKARLNVDSGTYSCNAENVAGNSLVEFDLFVVYRPTIKTHPVSVTAEEGSDVKMTCEFDGIAHPISEVLWVKDNDRMLTHSGHTNRNSSVLTLKNVDAHDSGQYTCIVNTKPFPPVISKSSTLTIMEKLKFHPTPIAKKMELGMPNKVPCKAQGKYPPTIKWYKVEEHGNMIDSFSENVQDANGTLYFSKVHHHDKGRYTCVAKNAQGVINVTIDIDVVVTPKFTVYPKNPTEVYEGYSVRLDCAAIGDPVPTIQWDSKIVDLTETRFQVFKNGSLLISEVHHTDEGTYGCTAGNSGGFNRTEVVLNVPTTEGVRPKIGNGSEGVDLNDGSSVGKTIVITLSASLAYILLVITLMVWCRYCRHRKKMRYLQADQDAAPNPNISGGGDVIETKDIGGSAHVREGQSSKASGNEVVVHSLSASNSKQSVRAASSEALCFSRNNVHDILLLGSGKFGSVYLAQRNDNNEVVMLKAFEEVGEENLLEEFKMETNMLSHLHHQHMVKMLGLSKESTPHCIIIEYTDWGDLKQLLVATRKRSFRRMGSKQHPPPLTMEQCLNIVKQMASAMNYCAGLGIVHKDLAARNCLITSYLDIKITFASLYKDVYAAEYYEIRKQMLPLRWMPRESAIDGEYSEKSDIYSYACIIWELYTKGELPFPKLSNKDVLAALEKRAIQWKAHKSIPIPIWSIMQKCFALTPNERPTFSELIQMVNDIPKSKPQPHFLIEEQN